MHRALTGAMVVATLSCGVPERQSHSLSLNLLLADGTTASVRLNGPAGFGGVAGTSTVRASWPFIADEREDRFVTELTPWRLGTFEAHAYEARVGGAAYRETSERVLRLHVERIQWNHAAHFPWTHHGRISGHIGDVAVSGAFTTSESGDCDNPRTRPGAMTCGTLWPVDFEAGEPAKQLRFEVVGLASTCPTAIRNRFFDGTSASLTRERFRVGSAQEVPCVATDLPSEVASGWKRVPTTRITCGLDTVIEVDGCRWATTVNVFDQLQLFITAAVVDGSCGPQACLLTAPLLPPVP
ncbi:MAG: hypothetical protein JNG84_12750 [Archangium sp.]|nr:hypothetical protein [Archangium sp.]